MFLFSKKYCQEVFSDQKKKKKKIYTNKLELNFKKSLKVAEILRNTIQ